MNTEETKAILAEIHKAIDEAAESVVSNLEKKGSPDLTYPPSSVLTEEERNALASLTIDEVTRTALKKLVRDACSYPTFHMLSLLDGVTEPYVVEVENWLGGSIGSDSDDTMLHDQFYETLELYEK